MGSAHSFHIHIYWSNTFYRRRPVEIKISYYYLYTNVVAMLRSLPTVSHGDECGVPDTQ